MGWNEDSDLKGPASIAVHDVAPVYTRRNCS